MKYTRLLLIFLFVIAVAIGGLYLFKPSIFNRQDALFPSISAEPIQLDDNAKIHFFRNGIAVTSDDTSFYTYDGTELSLPFTQQDIENMGNIPIINKSTDNYALINNRYIYNTYAIPFEMIYEIPGDFDGWDIKEFGDLLLIVLKDSSDQLKLQLLKKGNNIPADLSGMEHSSFLDASYSDVNKLISILTIATDTPNPSTRVFHFTGGNSPYGVLSLDDIALYKIYSTQDRIVLIGIHQIMCYNIDGSHIWTLHGPNSCIHRQANFKNDMLLYFNNARYNKANAIYINEKGEMETKEFPNGLTSVQTYKNEYIIALEKNNIVIVDKNGYIQKRYNLDISPAKLYWTAYSPNNIYVVDKNNLLHTYVLGKSNIRKDGN